MVRGNLRHVASSGGTAIGRLTTDHETLWTGEPGLKS